MEIEVYDEMNKVLLLEAGAIEKIVILLSQLLHVLIHCHTTVALQFDPRVFVGDLCSFEIT